MRRLTSILFMVLIGTLTLSTSGFARNHRNEAGRPKYATYGGGGDDQFPWPWGTECPFPWEDIVGTYRVQSPKNGPYNGHFIVFDVEQNPSRPDLTFLQISEYDSTGQLFARGKGYSQRDSRVVRGVLKQEGTGSEYTVMVRTYRRTAQSTCSARDFVTAITFCPLHSRSCKSNANYVLVKAE